MLRHRRNKKRVRKSISTFAGAPVINNQGTGALLCVTAGRSAKLNHALRASEPRAFVSVRPLHCRLLLPLIKCMPLPLSPPLLQIQTPLDHPNGHLNDDCNLPFLLRVLSLTPSLPFSGLLLIANPSPFEKRNYLPPICLFSPPL